jgi:hypothetical protein
MRIPFHKIKQRFPLTLVGFLCILLSLGLFWFSKEEKDIILYYGTASLIVLIIGAMLQMLITAWLLARSFKSLPEQVEPLSIEVGQQHLGMMAFDIFPKNPFSQIKIKWESPSLQTFDLILHEGKLVEYLSFAKRGRITEVTRLIEVSDIFGFASISWSWTTPCLIKILPASSQSECDLLQREHLGEGLYDHAGSPEGDLMEIRRYQDGDPLKMIIWKAFAKSGKLLVRMPERSFEIKQDLAAYFIASPKDEPSATTLRAFLAQKLLGDDFILFADGNHQSATDEEQALSLLIDSSNATTGSAFDQLLSLPQSKQRGCLFFLSAEKEVIDFAIAAAQSLPSPPIFVVSMGDRDFEVQPESFWYRFKLKQQTIQPNEGVSPSELLGAYQTLLSYGKIIHIFAQPEGRLWSSFELESLMEKQK